MEFNSHFALIQGVLKNQEKLNGKLSDVHFGNDMAINQINKKLSEALGEALLCENDLRRIYLFFLINTDHDCYDLLFDELNCGHIVGMIPKLSKDLFIEVATHLKLDNFIHESILFLPPVFSIEVIEIFSKFLKKSLPLEQLKLKYVDFILRTLFIKIVALDMKDKKNSDEYKLQLKCCEYFKNIIEVYKKLINFDYSSWREDKIYFFHSCYLRSLTSIVKTICTYFIDPSIVKNEVYYDIYNFQINERLSRKKNSFVDVKPCDLLADCVKLTLSYFSDALEKITIYTWIGWTDLEEYTDENVQCIIGNEMYYCSNYVAQQKIKDAVDPHTYSQLSSRIRNFIIKPLNEDDEIRDASIETVIENIGNPTKNRAKWLSSLISNFETVRNVECLIVIQKNIDLLSQKDVELFLKKSVKYFQNCATSQDHVSSNLCKNIILNSLKNFHVDNQLVILESFINQYGLTDLLKLPEFDTEMTEVFNKVVDMDDHIIEFCSDFLRITFQSPSSVLNKTLRESLSSKQHGILMIKLLKLLEPVCRYKYSKDSSTVVIFDAVNCMTTQIEEFTAQERENFIILIQKLINKKMINGSRFLSHSVQKNLFENVRNNRTCLSIFWLDVLKIYVDGSITEEDGNNFDFTSVVLFLASILDNSRCYFSNFILKNICLYEKALDVLITLLESTDVDDLEINAVLFLQNEMANLNIISAFHILSYLNLPSLRITYTNPTEYYWLKLILCGGEPNDLSLLYTDMGRENFTCVLFKLLPQLTHKEWKIMFNNLSPRQEPQQLCLLYNCCLFAVIFLAKQMNEAVSIRENKLKTATGIVKNTLCYEISSFTSCIGYCIQNLFLIFQDIVIPHVNEIENCDLSNMFSRLCRLSQYPKTEHSGSLLVNFLKKIMSSGLSRPKRDVLLMHINEYCASIGLSSDVNLRNELVKNLLSVLSNENSSNG